MSCPYISGFSSPAPRSWLFLINFEDAANLPNSHSPSRWPSNAALPRPTTWYVQFFPSPSSGFPSLPELPGSLCALVSPFLATPIQNGFAGRSNPPL